MSTDRIVVSEMDKLKTVHLTALDILLYKKDALKSRTRILIEKHLKICASCKNRFLLLNRLSNKYGNESYQEKISNFFIKLSVKIKEYIGKRVERFFFKPLSGIAGRFISKLSGFTKKQLFKIKLAWGFSILMLILITGIFIPLTYLDNSKEDSTHISLNTRIKGLEPYINVYILVNNRLEPIPRDYIARENDCIQLSYVAGGMKYGTIFSIDGRGYITWHYPEHAEEENLLLTNEKETFLTYSFRLDDAPFYEHFFFITSETPFSIERIKEAAQELTTLTDTGIPERLQLPSRFKQYSFTIYKETHIEESMKKKDTHIDENK